MNVVSIIRPELCIRCKGRLWCGLERCPLLEARRRLRNVRVSREIEGYTPPSLLVGWKGYPNVNVTPLVTQEDPRVADNPPLWVSRNFSIDDILDVRLHTGGGKKRIRVDEPDRILSTVQELAMSRKPVATDVEFYREPRVTVSFSNLFPPIGFQGPLRRIVLSENPKVDKRVEKLYYDEVKARDAVIYLYERGYDVYNLARYLTAGILGVQKRLVPTRWAITAVDSMVSEHLLQEIYSYPPVESVLLFHSSLYDNHFYIFFIPGPWAFELVEAWAARSFWASGKKVILSDGEFGRERKTYAENVGGSYYATKLAVLEKLRRMRRIASVLVLREVREGYYAPLGVWQVRENVRHALSTKPLSFSSLREALLYAKEQLGMRVDIEDWRKKSELMKGVQRRLF